MGMSRARLDDWYEGHLYMAMEERQAAKEGQAEMLKAMGLAK